MTQYAIDFGTIITGLFSGESYEERKQRKELEAKGYRYSELLNSGNIPAFICGNFPKPDIKESDKVNENRKKDIKFCYDNLPQVISWATSITDLPKVLHTHCDTYSRANKECNFAVSELETLIALLPKSDEFKKQFPVFDTTIKTFDTKNLTQNKSIIPIFALGLIALGIF